MKVATVIAVLESLDHALWQMLLDPFRDRFSSFSILFDLQKTTPPPQLYPLRSRHPLSSSREFVVGNRHLGKVSRV